MSPLRIAALAVPLCAAVLPGLPRPAAAQSPLSVMIDRCSRGDRQACDIGNRMAIQRRQQLFARTMPPAGNGLYVPCVAPSVCGSVGGNALPGNWGWTHQLFGDIRRSYPQAWYPMFPGTYGR